MAGSPSSCHCEHACIFLLSWAAIGKNTCPLRIKKFAILYRLSYSTLCRLEKWVLVQLPYLFHFPVSWVYFPPWHHQPWVGLNIGKYFKFTLCVVIDWYPGNGEYISLISILYWGLVSITYDVAISVIMTLNVSFVLFCQFGLADLWVLKLLF